MRWRQTLTDHSNFVVLFLLRNVSRRLRVCVGKQSILKSAWRTWANSANCKASLPTPLLTLPHAVSVCVTAGCPSVRPSIPSIDSSSDMRLVCCWVRSRSADSDRCLQAPKLQLRVAPCWQQIYQAQHRLVYLNVKNCILAQWVYSILAGIPMK